MAVLVIADVTGGQLAQDMLAKTLGAASAFGDLHVLVAGPAQAAQDAATFAGVSKVLHLSDAGFAHALAEPLADVVVALASGYEHILGASAPQAKNLLPRVAALLDVMVLSDVSAVLSSDTFERPCYAGNAIQRVQSLDKIKVLTIRTASFAPVGKGNVAPIEILTQAASTGLSAWVEDKIAASLRPELTSAKAIVAGGRGVGSKEGFGLLEGLADKLGGAIGASRAAVDSDYAPSDWQIGQTGKVVAPDLYIAAGISGAIQHLAGMKDSKVIVAINKDGDAPIFEVADYGIVGDLFEILPQITAKV